MEQSDLDYFKKGEAENLKYWGRLGGKPNLRGKICCDIGCGHGSLVINMASEMHTSGGGGKVLGFDLDEKRTEFAKENLQKNFPHLVEYVSFHCADFRDAGEKFDVITSKDACEHILYLREMLLSVKEKLSHGGYFYTGFGPLYNSFNGGHDRFNNTLWDNKLPWGHLFIPQTKEELYAKGLNGLSLEEYKEIFHGIGMEVVSFNVNVSKNKIMKLLTLLSRIKFLREYCSCNIYAILRKH